MADPSYQEDLIDLRVDEHIDAPKVADFLHGNLPGSDEPPRKMSEALIDSMPEFRAVDYESIGLADLGKPEGFIARQIDGWFRCWESTKNEDVPEMADVYSWLRENLPSSEIHSLVHNDFKLDNAMFAAANPARIVSIFDWDMCTLGGPLSDLGALLAYWSEPSDPAYALEMARMPTGDLAFLTRAQLVQRYAAKTERSVEHINFYYALALFRITVIIAQIYIRFLRGQTQDQRFSDFGKVIPHFARMAQGVAAGEMGIKL